MKMNRLLSALAVFALVLAACAPATTAPPQDKLAEILARGTLIVSTDPAYPPQSELKPDGARTEGTKCATDQKTAGELAGFDIETAVGIAKGLGVEACFVTPDWTLITAGGWANRWDLSVGSMTVTPERMQSLYFAQPYYTTPAAIFVHKDNTTLTGLADLAGKNVGVCSGCTYEAYLNGTLQIPGETINFAVQGATIKGYDTDTTALQDLALGDGVRLDAVVTAEPTGQGFIADGQPLKQLGEPIYFEYLAPALDKAATLNQATFFTRLNEVVQQLHKDGTLRTLSEKHYGTDLTSAAATFNVASLNQNP